MADPKIKKYIPGEETILEIRPSFLILAGQLLPLIVLLVAFDYILYTAGLRTWWVYLIIVLVIVFVGVVIFFNWYYTIYHLTNRRVENRVGIFGSREEEISLDDIQAVDVDQTLWGAVFGFGTVIIKASGSNREVDFTNVARPKKIASTISDLAIPLAK